MRRRCGAGCTALLLVLLAAVPASPEPSDRSRDHGGLPGLAADMGVQVRVAREPSGPIALAEMPLSTVDREGTVYFAGPGADGRTASDIYRARRAANGRYAQPELLSSAINTPGREYAPFIAPDGSYLLFAREDPLLGIDSFFLSFRTEDREWTEAIYLREFVPTSGHCLSIRLTPDGSTIVFSEATDGRRRVGQVEAGFVEDLRQQVFGSRGSAIRARAGACPRLGRPAPASEGPTDRPIGVASAARVLQKVVERPEAVRPMRSAVPRLPYSSSATAATTRSPPSRTPPSTSAFTAPRHAARLPFMSCAPRP